MPSLRSPRVYAWGEVTHVEDDDELDEEGTICGDPFDDEDFEKENDV